MSGMPMMKCGDCGKEYNRPNWDRTDPETGVPVCECGYRFGLDKWRRQTELPVDGDDVIVSTVFLEYNHGVVGRGLWYETLIMHPDGSRVADRYQTQEAALDGHDEIVEQLREGDLDARGRRE